MTSTCPACGRPVEVSAGPGRAARYCSQACRQSAYRNRRQPADIPVRQLISDLSDGLHRLRLTPAAAFRADVEALSGPFAALRRYARKTGPLPASPADTPTDTPTDSEIVTPTSVTKTGDDAFAALVEQHRAELRAHCYRLLGSYDEAEDLTQEAFMRAWRSQATLEIVENPRAWLYRIATNVCLDFLRTNKRRPVPYEPVPGIDSGGGTPPLRIPWLQPFPDDQLPEAAGRQHVPDEEAVAGETLELVLLTAIQQLPPRQRAAVILRDVAGWTAQETAELLGSSLASANSTVQRGRAALRQALPGPREDWSAREPTVEDRELLRRYMDAMARSDVDAMVDIVRADAVLTMPPNPFWFTSREAILAFIRPNLDPASPMYVGQWRNLPIRANGQPAVAGYLQRPGTTVFRAQLIDVLHVAEGKIAAITTFEPHHFPAFGLPMTI